MMSYIQMHSFLFKTKSGVSYQDSREKKKAVVFPSGVKAVYSPLESSLFCLKVCKKLSYIS